MCREQWLTWGTPILASYTQLKAHLGSRTCCTSFHWLARDLVIDLFWPGARSLTADLQPGSSVRDSLVSWIFWDCFSLLQGWSNILAGSGAVCYWGNDHGQAPVLFVSSADCCGLISHGVLPSLLFLPCNWSGVCSALEMSTGTSYNSSSLEHPFFNKKIIYHFGTLKQTNKQNTS